jgi:F-type H+-transporting ATPase subunit delta
MTLLAKRYAQALFLLSKQKGVLDAVAADVQALHGAVAAPGARSLLESPDVRGDERTRVMQTLGRGKNPLVQNLLGVLQHRRRLEVLFDLHAAFRALVLDDRGEVEGRVETPHPIGDAELASLQQLAGRLSGKKVSLQVAVRPELLGGVRLFVGNVLYDGSLKATLAQLERQLLQAAI